MRKFKKSANRLDTSPTHSYLLHSRAQLQREVKPPSANLRCKTPTGLSHSHSYRMSLPSSVKIHGIAPPSATGANARGAPACLRRPSDSPSLPRPSMSIHQTEEHCCYPHKSVLQKVYWLSRYLFSHVVNEPSALMNLI